ncbi:uncharacterized protein EAE97_005333 [Botrytis byssoidea]|uniref:Heterokaryon incompatibility domain-containing protein n=1 Tax=Botrytis byssoidea TaxID=139641 RepID=A0A9P5M371_9HELO|nr:uncharacterized protein EAE97_005333 [Botrytis byssoidea]KAF7944700.1 hypothetical protein EAE97_005333 [Botrytis byssoidea]
MRLINTSSLCLEEFYDGQIPAYAILSHRWGKKEVTFHDMQAGDCMNVEGFAKIQGCCKQAGLDGWMYVWIDTCCIDKASSTELSEAINSMFQWYQKAEICYAYLGDIENRPDSSKPAELKSSDWFTRGWTLQELLAPKKLAFFDRNWDLIGRKEDLQGELREITGILDMNNRRNASIAQKMSWASRRSTTRVEDQAYSLLGLFDVNMASLYGEGKRAFMRLQLEIWLCLMMNQYSHGEIQIVSKAFDTIQKWNPNSTRRPYLMTNKGLQLESPLATPFTDCSCGYVRHLAHESSAYPSDTKLAPLQCCYEGNTNSGNPYVLAVYLIRNRGNEFSKIDPESIEMIDIRQLDRSPLSHLETGTSPCLDKFSASRIQEYMESIFVRQHQAINKVLDPYDIWIETKALAELGFTMTTEWLSNTRQTKLVKFEDGIRVRTSQLQSNGMTTIITFTHRTSMERGYLGIYAFVFNITITSHGPLVSLMEVPVHQKQRILEYEQESFIDRRALHAKSLLRQHYAGDLVALVLTKVEDIPPWLNYRVHFEFKRKSLQTHGSNGYSLKEVLSGFWAAF